MKLFRSEASLPNKVIKTYWLKTLLLLKINIQAIS